MNGFYLAEHSPVFFAPRFINRIVGIFAGDRFIGRNDQHTEFVNVEKLRGLGFGGAGHAGQLLIKAEIILNGNGGQRLRLALDGDLFLGLNGLV